MRSKRLTRQVAAIYFIITATFLGSALFFFYLNTEAMMNAVESETNLSSSFLAASIVNRLPTAFTREDLVQGTLKATLGERLPQVLAEAEEDIDVWVMNAEDHALFERGGAFPKADWTAAREELGKDGELCLRWSGRKNPFRLDQTLLLVRRMPENGLYLLMLNHLTHVSAVQRRQFALFGGIELVLVSLMIVLLANTIYGYRRQLIQLATTDELTGLANRKSFMSAYREFTGKQTPSTFSLFLCDIDFFKQVNDTYGHAAGDQALKTLADHIAAMVKRQGGFAGRWGGDEFIGVLPMGDGDALEALKQLCRDVRAAKLEGDHSITISVGVAEAEGDLSLSKLSERADAALYCSKEQGRNQANLYDPARIVPSAAASGVVAVEAATAAPSKAPAASVRQAEPELTLGQRVKRYVRERLLPSTLNGVHWMAPFVAGGGILIGMAFLFDASSINLSALPVAERANFGSITRIAATLKSIGGATFNFMLPVFAGFMAYGLAGENAFMAGFVGGYMTIESNSGFIGAMVAGFAAGMIASQMEQFISRTPELVRRAAPIVIYPVFNLVLMQALTWGVITPLSNAIGRLFTTLLERAVADSPLAAGALSAGMMAIDMGGIVNKVAYNYGVNGLAQGRTALMASVMAGGMVPPLGIALSMLLFRRKYRQEEHERLAGTLFMGLSFITEGALPFVFTDFLRVIPASIVGSALAGLLSALYACALPAPHGGIFVVPVMDHPFLYAVALACGALVTAVILGLWKRKPAE